MPLPAKGDKLGDVQVKGAPPILVVATTGDPATPYAVAQTFLERIPGSSLLTFDSTEHTGARQRAQRVHRRLCQPLPARPRDARGGDALLDQVHA